jgi:tetratricopeptide (TPR) repeat protein
MIIFAAIYRLYERRREASGALNNLGVLGKFAGRFDEAAECYRRALAILEYHYSKDCAEAASIYHNLGGLEHARGRFAEGEPFLTPSLSISPSFLLKCSCAQL